MSETNLLKLLEAGALLLALGVFVWWQMRDLERARQATARQRAMEAAQAAPDDPPEPSDLPGHSPKHSPKHPPP